MLENLRRKAELARRAASYAARKDTPEFAAEQEAARDETVSFIVGLGYSEARAARAVQEYADAAAETRTGPDWPGFRHLAAAYGLSDD